MDAPEIIELKPGGILPELGPVRPFRIVIVADTDVDLEWRYDVAKHIVHAGCLYAMTWGADCAGWEDYLDWAEVEKAEAESRSDGSYVLTTCHEGESLDETFWFAAHAAHHPDVALKDTVILHISETPNADGLRETYRRASLDEG